MRTSKGCVIAHAPSKQNGVDFEEGDLQFFLKLKTSELVKYIYIYFFFIKYWFYGLALRLSVFHAAVQMGHGRLCHIYVFLSHLPFILFTAIRF